LSGSILLHVGIDSNVSLHRFRFAILVINLSTPIDIRFPLIFIGLLGLLQHMVDTVRLF